MWKIGDYIQSPPMGKNKDGGVYEVIELGDFIRLRHVKTDVICCEFPTLEILAEYTQGWIKVE